MLSVCVPAFYVAWNGLAYAWILILIMHVKTAFMQKVLKLQFGLCLQKKKK